MNKKGLIFLLSCFVSISMFGQSKKYAEQVINRYAGGKAPVKLSLSLKKHNGCDQYETSVKNGVLTVKGSSNIALCRGFYDYVKSKNAGINSWSGNRYALPAKLNNEGAKKVVSPFEHHYYFNVVTYGYTMPYWDWSRWEKELDWMALHGMDMPLALVANEAISARVWRKLGLTDEEIQNYFVGPAHLPWMRMGNISGIDGPMTDSWHNDQIALQHKILDRMRALQMTPICPGFAGFVPKSLTRIYPNVKLLETSWCDGAFHNWMLSPEEPLFHEIGKMFIQEWEKEFGKCDYYLVDSFNEMDIPFPPKDTEERYTLLANYGDEVYSSIKAGNPDAVWVMQGWMFGYQRDIWDYKTLQALVSKVPDDKMLLLDLAADYNKCLWKNGMNYDFYKGFYNKNWVYSVIPNMGGKTGRTGDLEFYANGRLEVLRSPNKGRLIGFGMAPEGIENNEVIYELLSDAGWSSKYINVDEWLRNYSECRYGGVNSDIMNFWNDMRKSVYGSFTDHPRYNWQFRPGTVMKGTINANAEFYKGIESLEKAIPEFGKSPLFEVDMVEMAMQYAGGCMEQLAEQIQTAYKGGKAESVKHKESDFLEIGLMLDRLLESHPTLRMENWIGYARLHGESEAQKDKYEHNARRLITIWGPPVDDYSARIWSGLVRDYYMPRWKNYFESQHSGQKFDFAAWERNWVENKIGVSAVEPYNDVLSACKDLIKKSKQAVAQ